MKKIKLFCYPWSGGNGALFFKYSKLLGENFDIIPSDMDIDESKSFKENITAAADKVTKKLEKDEMFILFGHSMGAVVAFEIAKLLVRKIDCDRMGLIISGMLPPTRELLDSLTAILPVKAPKAIPRSWA